MPFPNKNDEQLGLQNNPVTLAGFMGGNEEEEANKKRGLIGRKVTAKI